MPKINFLKELGQKELLAPHLNGWFGKAKFPKNITFTIHPNKEKDDAFHPSSDATLCARALYAKRRGDLPQKAHDSIAYKTFFYGHYVHAMVQHIVISLNLTERENIEREYRYYRYRKDDNSGIHAWWGRGFVDIAHCQIPNRGEYLVDIKTLNANIYRQQRLPAALWDKYFCQVQLYLDWSHMEKAILLCAEKDSPHRFKEIIIEKDPAVVERIYARWDSVIAAEYGRQPPACDICEPNGLRCVTEEIYV